MWIYIIYIYILTWHVSVIFPVPGILINACGLVPVFVWPLARLSPLGRQGEGPESTGSGGIGAPRADIITSDRQHPTSRHKSTTQSHTNPVFQNLISPQTGQGACVGAMGTFLANQYVQWPLCLRRSSSGGLYWIN